MSNCAITDRVGLDLRAGQAERGSAAHPPGSLGKLQDAASVLIATLREIFEESAYMRFLSKRGLGASQASYAAFQRDQEVIKARRPRCC
jgi:hypothetical protein